MKYLALSTALFLVACNGSPDTVSVDQETGDSALAALHLANSGDGAVLYGARSFDDGVYTFTDVVFTDMSDSDGDAGAEADSGDADGEMSGNVEFDEIRAARMVLAAPRFDETGNVIFDRLSIEEAVFAEPEGDEDSQGGFDSFVIETPNAVMVADIARGFSGEDVDDDETDPAAYRFGLVSLEGLAIDGTDDESGEDFAVSLTRFALDNYDGEHLDRFELMGLNINAVDAETGPVRITLAELSMDGIGQSFFAPFTQGMREAMAEQAGEIAEAREVSANYDPMDAYDAFAMRGLDVNVGGILVTMDSMTASIDETRDGLVGVSEMTPLVVRPDTEYQLGAQMALGLGLLGYQQLEFTAASESVYDVDADRSYTRGENYFELTEGFRIETEMDVSGILEYSRRAMSLSMAQSEDFDVAEMLEPLMLNRLVLRIEDHSILDRALTAGSAAQGMSKAELRQQAAAMITLGMLGAPAEIPRPLLTQLSEALVGFINDGGAVTIALEPAEPLSVGALMEEAEANALDFDSMGLSITNEPADAE
tara:strand:+ start:3186 stop:4802 length:1617 start_codon:yes stop_codon:yes gene_type:complete